MDAAAKLAMRPAGCAKLVAVSKRQPDDRILNVLQSGQACFGENKVQEAQARWGERFSLWRDSIELRLIGPLQTNKAQAACELFDVIETLDRPKLAGALRKAMDKSDRSPEIFVQVNTGEEPQKSGILPQDLSGFLNLIDKDFQIKPAGLMCIPPASDPSGRGAGEAPGPHFALLAKLAAEHGLANLSMGMSSDFETAIGFGATHVRVGSALFGSREA